MADPASSPDLAGISLSSSSPSSPHFSCHLRGSQAGLLMCKEVLGDLGSLSPRSTKPGFQDHYLAKDCRILFSQNLNINSSLLYS